MNKNELIAAVAEKSALSKKDAECAVNAFVSVVTDTLAAGDKVQLVGFGTFEVKERAARAPKRARHIAAALFFCKPPVGSFPSGGPPLGF